MKAKELTLKIDLKPALSEEQLDHRVLREFEENQNRQFKNAVHKRLRQLKYVKEFRLGQFGEGDSGVTVVTFK